MARWQAKAGKYTGEVDLRKNFVCYGFQFLKAGKICTKKLRSALKNYPKDARPDVFFFDGRHKAPHDPRVIEVADTGGLEVYVISSKFCR